MRVALALATLAVAATPAAGATVVDGLSGDPLDRGAALALPSLYRVDARVAVSALRTADGTRVALPREGRVLTELGTAFGAAPGGWVVTAAHVARPGGASLAADAYQTVLATAGRPHSDALARRWVERTGARPVGVRLLSLTVSQADAGGGARRSRVYEPSGVTVDRASDLAVMRIPAPRAPSLDLDESASIGTPVVTIGYGTAGAFAEPRRGKLEPSVRRGRLGRTGTLPDPTDRSATPEQRRAVQVTTGVLPGDSGGPAVDGRGRVRGVVVKYNDDGGVIERASEVRMLLERAGVEAGADATATGFRRALERYWALDLGVAERGFQRTLERFPDHTLAGVLLDRAERIEAARPRLAADGGRRRAFLLALAAGSAAAAVACAVGLARGGRPRGGPPASAPPIGAGRRR